MPTIPINQWMGAPFVFDGDAGTISNHLIDSTTDAVYVVVQSETSDPITHVFIRTDTRTGDPCVHRASIQGVNLTTGLADGTVKGGGSPASATFDPPNDATWNGVARWIALDNAYTPAIGELLAFVVDYSSGTCDASNRIGFSYSLNIAIARPGFPYSVTVNSGTHTKVIVGMSMFGYKTASRTYGNPLATFAATTIASASSSPDEVAAAFKLFTGLTGTYQLSAVRVHSGAQAAKSYSVILYDGTTALQSLTWDTDVLTSAGSAIRLFHFTWPTPLANLTCGGLYRVGIKALDTTVSVSMQYATSVDQADLVAWHGIAADHYHSTRTDTGGWTDTLTRRVMAEYFVTELTISGGEVAVPFMWGG